MAKLEPLGIMPPRGAPLLRARPRAEPPLLHASKLDFAEIARVVARARARGPAAARPCSRRATCAIVCSQPRRRGRPRLALPRASTPTASARSSSRWRTRSARFRLLEERGGTPSPTSRSTHGRAAARSRTFNITTPLRRHHLPLRASGAATAALYPGIARHAAPRGGKNAFGFGHVDHVTSNFQTMKPALLWMEHVLGLRGVLGGRSSTPRTRPRRSARRSRRSGLGAPLRRHARPALGREVREQRAVAPGLQVARRSTSSTRTTAATASSTRRSRWRTSSRRCAACARAASSSCPRPGTYYDALPERIRTTGHRPDRRGRRDAAGARDPRGRRRAAALPAADLPARRGRPLPRARRRARSSSRSSSARATRASARATSARSSSRSSASSSARGGRSHARADRAGGGAAEAPHRVPRRARARLLHEEAFTRAGFDGPYTLAYHLQPPARDARRRGPRTAGRCPRAAPPRGRSLKRHYRTQDLAAPAAARRWTRGSRSSSTRDVVARPRDARRGGPGLLLERRRATTSSSCSRAAALLRSPLGDLRFERDDYVYVPKGLLHRFVPGRRARSAGSSLECPGGRPPPGAVAERDRAAPHGRAVLAPRLPPRRVQGAAGRGDPRARS